MCNVEGCHRAGWDICPDCALKERRRLRRSRNIRPEITGQTALKTKSYDQTRYRYWMKKIRDCVEKDTYLDGSPRKPEDRVKS